MARTLVWLLALSVGLSACGDGQEGSVASTQTTRPPDGSSTVASVTVTSTTPTSSTVPEATGDLDDLDDRSREIVEAALADLAERLDVGTTDIEVVSFEFVTWNDGSLGCPQPGEMYTQALVEGSRTVLEHDGVTYDYHAGADDQPFLCESPSIGSLPTTAPER
ncbi:MAG: hypothetical protein ACLFWM_00655 [Actinomycetota bacterium]